MIRLYKRLFNDSNYYLSQNKLKFNRICYNWRPLAMRWRHKYISTTFRSAQWRTLTNTSLISWLSLYLNFFLKQFSFLFHLFQVEWKTHTRVLKYCSTNYIIVYELLFRSSSSITLCCMNKGCRTTQSQFSRWNVSSRKNRNTDEYLRCHVMDCHQVFTRIIVIRLAI